MVVAKREAYGRGKLVSRLGLSAYKGAGCLGGCLGALVGGLAGLCLPEAHVVGRTCVGTDNVQCDHLHAGFGEHVLRQTATLLLPWSGCGSRRAYECGSAAHSDVVRTAVSAVQEGRRTEGASTI